MNTNPFQCFTEPYFYHTQILDALLSTIHTQDTFIGWTKDFCILVRDYASDPELWRLIKTFECPKYTSTLMALDKQKIIHGFVSRFDFYNYDNVYEKYTFNNYLCPPQPDDNLRFASYLIRHDPQCWQFVNEIDEPIRSVTSKNGLHIALTFSGNFWYWGRWSYTGWLSKPMRSHTKPTLTDTADNNRFVFIDFYEYNNCYGLTAGGQVLSLHPRNDGAVSYEYHPGRNMRTLSVGNDVTAFINNEGKVFVIKNPWDPLKEVLMDKNQKALDVLCNGEHVFILGENGCLSYIRFNNIYDKFYLPIPLDAPVN